MKRILIIGCPGSGKSTLAKSLHQALGLPLYHLDLLFWRENASRVSKEEFEEKLAAVLKQEQWIIDGNYQSTMEKRIRFCDAILFLDYPLEICLAGIEARKGKPRSDLPWIEQEDDAEFLQFIRAFAETTRPQILALLEKFPEKERHIFRTREEAARFLESISKHE